MTITKKSTKIIPSASIKEGRPVIKPANAEKTSPDKRPIIPPIKVIRTDSVRNSVKISEFFL